jgi:hypothetical protein
MKTTGILGKQCWLSIPYNDRRLVHELDIAVESAIAVSEWRQAIERAKRLG